MKFCYFVYREENVMVYTSQVLEYLKLLKEKPNVGEIGLVVLDMKKTCLRRKTLKQELLNMLIG